MSSPFIEDIIEEALVLLLSGAAKMRDENEVIVDEWHNSGALISTQTVEFVDMSPNHVIVRKYYKSSGRIYSEDTFKNGRQCGWSNGWFEDGSMMWHNEIEYLENGK